jgi:uncharacterized protein (DUF58 family)
LGDYLFKLPFFHRESAIDKPDKSRVLSAHAIRQLNRLQINTNRHIVGHGVGQRSSSRRKPSWDFLSHRMYVPGDDIRFVDWKASGRTEHIYIKQGEQQKEATVYILFDCSASMNWGEPSKSNLALSLLTALSYVTLNNGDRLMILPFFENISQPFGPVRGKGQLFSTYRYIQTASLRWS